MTIEVEGPGGVVVEFPDNTPREVMQAALQKHFGTPQDAARAELAKGLREGRDGGQDAINAAAFRTNQGVRPAGATDAAVNGATLGLADEVSAAGRAPIDMALRGESFGEAYSHNLAAERDRLNTYKKENPGKYAAAEAAGALGGTTLRKGADATLSALKLAGQATGLGFVSGAANSEGDLEDRAKQGAKGAAIGAGIGAALPVVTKVAGAILSPVTKNISAARNPDGRAVDQFAADLARDKVTPAMARAELAAAEAAGQPMTLADVGGRNVMGLARSVATGKSEGAEKVLSMIEARRMDAPERILSNVKSALGNGDEFAATLESIVAKRKEVAAPLYEAAYAKPAPETPVIKGILSRPAGQEAIRRAEKLAKNEGIEFKPDVRGLDYVKRGLDDLASAAGFHTNEGRVIVGMKNALTKEIDKAVPEYKAARQAFSSSMETQEALERGRTLLKSQPEQAIADIKAMSPSDREVARIGMAREIQAMFDDPRYTLSRVNQLLNSDRMKKITAAMFDTPQAFDKFRAHLSREAIMLRRGQKISGGSDTAPKLAEEADVAFNGAAKQLYEGKPIAAALSTAAQIGNRGIKGVNEKTANSLGDFLSSADPARQAEILSQIEKMLPKGYLGRLAGFVGGREAPNAIRK